MSRPERQLLVCVIGVDGSGKTTLCDRLAGAYGPRRAARLWLGAESVLMRPARAALRLLRRHKAEPGTGGADYRSEIAEKQTLSRRLRWLRPLYVFLALGDYRIQYLCKRLLNRGAEILILDRYFFDVGVNLALTLGWIEGELSAFLQRHFHRFALPRVRCLVRVPPEVAMQRKDDIPDAGYVEARVRYYERIARDFGFVVLDGTEPIEGNLARLQDVVERGRAALHVHYVHSNNLDVGGADFCLRRMAEAVRESGVVATVSLRLRTAISEQYAKARLPVIHYPFCRPQLSRGFRGVAELPFSGLVTLVYFLRLFRTLRPDIVHVNDLYDFLPALAARLCGIPVVYHIRMIRDGRLERRLFAFLLSRLSNATVCVSRAVRDAYFDGAPPGRDRAEVIYDWPNERFLAAGRNACPEVYADHPVRVVMVGRIDSWKGQHVFVEAVNRLRDRANGVGFYLVGGTVTGAEKSRYAEAVLSAAQSAGVVYLGERRDVRGLLRWADISVHASTSPDPFPGVVLESLLAGAATIGTDAGGVAEMIESGVHGIVVPPGDAGALAAALESLLRDPDRRQRLAKAGRERTLELADKAKLLGRIVALYRDVASPRPGAQEG